MMGCNASLFRDTAAEKMPMYQQLRMEVTQVNISTVQYVLLKSYEC